MTSKTMAATAANLTLSPANWAAEGGALSTINAGAYFSTMFTGTSMTLHFDAADLRAPGPVVYYRIDGYEAQAPWRQADVAATVLCAMPSDTQALPLHMLEMVVKATSETVNRWNPPSNTAVVLTGLTLDAGGTTMMAGAAAKRVVVYGDSITEGVHAVNDAATNDTHRNDALMGWAYAQRRLLGAEVGLIGFGATGLTVGGSGNVPALPSSYDQIMAGVPRATDPTVDLVVLNEGTNDRNAAAAAVTLALAHVLEGLVRIYPSATIAVLRPFGGYQAAALQAGVEAFTEFGNIAYVDTTGFLNTAYGIDGAGLHPFGPNNIGVIAPQVAARLMPLLHRGRVPVRSGSGV